VDFAFTAFEGRSAERSEQIEGVEALSEHMEHGDAVHEDTRVGCGRSSQ